MQFRSVSRVTLFLTLFALLLAGCGAESSITVLHITPTPTSPCSASSTKCPILLTPTPVYAKTLVNYFQDTSGYRGGQNHLLTLIGNHYGINVPIQVSRQAVPDTQGVAHTYGYSTTSGTATSGGGAGGFGVGIAFRCSSSMDISQDKVTIIGLETDDYTGTSIIVPLSAFCNQGNNVLPTDFIAA